MSICNKGFMWHFRQILTALDKFGNTLLGGWSGETLSSRCYRNAQKYTYAKWGEAVLNFVFRPFEEKGVEHCEDSYKSLLEDRNLPPELRNAK